MNPGGQAFPTMQRILGPAMGVFLVVVHSGLLGWSAIGFLELDPCWPLTRISNPLFSTSMLLWQWTLVSVAAVVFLIGFFARIRYLPESMSIVYGLMATTCAYQTFFILQHDSRFIQMAVEFMEYAVILLILFRMRWFQSWLRRS